jgi:hypothetical protein
MTVMNRLPHRFKKGEVSNPKGRPVGSKAKAVEKYLDVTAEVVTRDEWAEVVIKALEDAMSSSLAARQSGRNFLKSILIPSDPAAFMQIFAPSITIAEIRDQIKEIKALRVDLMEELDGDEK